MKRGVDLFVGTTGRVKDHIERGNIDFSDLKTVILDEADIMLKLGFKEDVEEILGKIRQEIDKESLQIALFSATVPEWVRDIARQHMKPDFKVVDLCKDLSNKTAKNVRHIAIESPYHDRLDALTKVRKYFIIMTISVNCYGGTGRVIVFSSTKADANSLLLSDKITHDVEVMHGDIAQNQREVTIKRFKDAKFQVLVATDVASRGLDIPNVELVIQLEPPKDTESYIHRSGRTARAGKFGICITFYNRRNEEFLLRIEDLAGIRMERLPVPSAEDMKTAKNKDVLRKLKDVDMQCLDGFDEAAKILLEDCRNDAHMAIKKCLAFCSGNFKASNGAVKSLINGRDGYQTIKMSVEEGNQLDSSLVNEIIHRFWSPRVEGQVRNMKDISDGCGVVFDLRADHADAFMENFDHMKATQGRKVDFECVRCRQLPKIVGGEGGGSSYSRGGRDGYGGDRRGGGGGGYGRGPRDDRSPRGRGGDRGGNGGDRGYGGGRRNNEDRDRGYGGGNSGGGAGWGNDSGAGGNAWNKGDDRNVIGSKRPSYNNFDEKPVVKRQMTDFNGFGGGGSSYYNGESTAYSRNDDHEAREDQPTETLYFGNINYEANENDLMEFVADLGFQPMRARMNLDKESGKSKGSAFIQMSSVEEASAAIKELNNEEFFGRQLAVRFKAQNN